MTDIFNSVPGNISLGVKDNSARTVPSTTELYPQCVSLVYVQTKKGKTGRFYGTTSEADSHFGADSFESTSKYFNHQSRLRNKIAAAGGNCVYQRVVDPDNKLKANLRVYLDVLKTKIPNYKRNSNGSFFLNQNKKVLDDVNPYIDGYFIKWYKTADAVENAETGSTPAKTGGMVRWKFEEDTVHLLSKDTNIDTDTTGHMQYAGKTVYTYLSEDEMFNPSAGVSVRKRYQVNLQGDRGQATEETFVTDLDATQKSMMYPILEATASHVGEWYNQVGFAIESVIGSSANPNIMKALGSYPYRLVQYTKSSPKSSPSIFSNLNGEPYTDFVFKSKAINPVTNGEFSFEYATEFTFYNEVDKNRTTVYKDMEPIYFYRNNFEKLLKEFMNLEKEYISYDNVQWEDGEESSTMMWYDYSDADEETLISEFGIINPFTCKSTRGIDYFTLAYENTKPTDDVAGMSEINLVTKTPLFLENGSDGNLTVEKYEEFVQQDLEKYGDENGPYMDLSVNPETFLWDNGFSQDTKDVFNKFIALRKDTVAVLSTVFDSNKNKITSPSEQLNIGSNLVSKLRFYVESDVYGTDAMRAAVVMGTGRELSSSDRYSLIEDLAVKTVKLMGGTGTKWDATELFDSSPKNQITELIDVEPKELPKNLQTSLSNSRINYPLPNQHKGHFFPALSTVYSKDTSIAHGFINMIAIPFADRVAHYSWLEHTGDIKRTEAQFVTAVTNYANQLLNNAYGGIINPVAKCIIDEADKARGYSWHLEITINGNVMKTKQLSSTLLDRNDK